MLNMTVEQFKEQLDEILKLHKQIMNKQEKIHLWAVDNTILCHETEIVLHFAKRYELTIDVEKNTNAPNVTCAYQYLIGYEDIHLQCFSTKEEYQLYKEGGLIS